MRRHLVATFAALSVGLASCSSEATPPADPTPSPSGGASTVASTSEAPAVPAEELAGRLLGVGVTDFESAVEAVDLGVRHLFIGTQTDKSILNGQGDPTRSLAALEERAGEPLVVSVDEEGGLVQRLAELIGPLPSAREMAETMNPEQVRGLMAEHGRKIRELGITVDFAPVVDLGVGAEISDNAIGSRAFSADPVAAADYARAYAQGLLDAGVTPVLKHFPGHGHATGDSHLGGVTTPPLGEMQDVDLLPFAELVGMEGVSVMVGHVQVPGLDGTAGPGIEVPSSVNPAAYDLLRAGGYGPGGAAPGFGGVIYTDDLTGMKAVTDLHPGGSAAVAALEAGADIALAAAGAVSIPEVVEQIRLAIVEGKISEEHVRAAVERAAGSGR
ncbi:MAG TPA: glycoside hydrolase family 3 protein [Candidatus Corynebacterium gallistercoris]|uniref:beta-N-acetylhexosaminidase n=1 Tax=Candidatus Corynebacterium gallistercoris TaxID=2838530 RepID=A0A9D1UPK9_9CORY|nr:glycoside hydrolase family 3 protein [Candidatus Corynebacterium gallistercoris]